MKPKRLTRGFFNRSTLAVARELLGKFLVRKTGGKTIAAMITETEAYCGPHDLASHASRGKTKRTEIMFGPPGRAYVYLVYGMYHCFNVVTEHDGYPAAVLIRGCELINPKSQITPKERLRHPTGQANYKQTLNSNDQNSKPFVKSNLVLELNGPGKLCRHLKIDKKLNNEDLAISKKLWLEDRGVKIKLSAIRRSPRIGIDYAGKYKNKPWRFCLDRNSQKLDITL